MEDDTIDSVYFNDSKMEALVSSLEMRYDRRVLLVENAKVCVHVAESFLGSKKEQWSFSAVNPTKLMIRWDLKSENGSVVLKDEARRLESKLLPQELLGGNLNVGISSVGQITLGEFEYLDVESALFSDFTA